jgi:hypothetical protein
VLYLPQHTNYRNNNTAQFGRQALEAHSRFLFPYEFSQGTIADGPETGMEYPMIIFNGSSLSVTVHEFGHQWFPMMIGSNETRYGFMDEGFDNFIDAYASAVITRAPLNLNNGSGYRRIAGTEYEAPMMWLADWAGPGSGTQAYSKAGVALNALGGIVGDSAVARAFAEYAKAWKYKHPTPYDFFFSMNHSLGRNFDWFWYQWFFTTYTVDQAIDSVSVDASGDGVAVTVRDNGDMAMPVILNFEMTDGQSTLLKAPADVWFSGNRTYVARLPLMGKKLKSISLDPENRFQDLDTSNNIWPGK